MKSLFVSMVFLLPAAIFSQDEKTPEEPQVSHSYKFKVSAFIDGVSRLIIFSSGKEDAQLEMKWTHLRWGIPGKNKEEGIVVDKPTKISVSNIKSGKDESVEWNAVFPLVRDDLRAFFPREILVSESFKPELPKELLPPLGTGGPDQFKVRVLNDSRMSVSILRYPKRNLNWRHDRWLEIEFDDEEYNGGELVEVEIEYSDEIIRE